MLQFSHRLKGFLPSALALLLVVVFAPAAQARPELRAIDPDLADLPFGKDGDAVVGWVAKRIDRVYAPRIKHAGERAEKDRLRAQREREVAEVRDNVVHVDPGSRPFAATPLSDELAGVPDETVYTWRQADETHYFVVVGGKLWRYLQVMPSGPTWDVRLAASTKALGVAEKLDKESDGEGGQRVMQATWSNAGQELRVANRRMLYGRDVLVVSDTAVGKALGTGARVGSSRGRGVDDSLKSFLLDDPHGAQELLDAQKKAGPR